MKKLVSLFLCLILLMGMLPLDSTPVRAASEGDWEYSISGNSATITKYNGASNSVIIPSTLGGKPVTHIGRSAFYRCTILNAITIPNSVTSIGSNAFYGCTDLTTVIIPDSVITIDSFAFEGCISLTSITIPKSVTKIDSFAFEDCDAIKRVDISDLATWCNIEFGNHSANPLDYAHALYLNGRIITKLLIPVGTTSIGSYAFSGCSTIQSVTIPESVTRIGEGAFYKCSELSSVIIPSGVTYINDKTFEDCSGLISISIPTGVTGIGSSAFEGCEMLNGVEIPPSVTCINDSTFEDCSSLTSITIPSGVTSIGFSAFYGCERLTNVKIPNGVKSIGGHSFSHCSGLTELSIPSGVVSIGDFAFSLCSNLTSVSIPASMKNIGESAFAGCSLTSLIIPKNVSVIGENAFHYCNTLMSAGPIGSGCDIEFGWTDSIPDYAFSGCTSIQAIIIPRTIVEIRHSVFSGCDDLKHVYFGGTKAQWEEILLFGNNDPLQNAVLHYGYKPGDPLIVASGSCGDSLTWTLDHKGKLTVSGTGIMNSSPFDYSTRQMIRSVVINNGATSVGSYAFSNCQDLTSVTIPKSVTSIGSGAFFGCTSLTEVYYGGTEAEWNTINTGYDNAPLTSATIHYTEPLDLTSVSANKTSAVAGDTLTWTASATGGSGALKYYFILYKDGAKVTTRAYSTANSFTYTPTEPGTYKVRVYVKDALDTKVNKLSSGVKVTGPITVTGITADTDHAAVGEVITWSASASGGDGTLQYWFRIYKDGTVVKKGTYGTAQTFSFIPTEPGAYKAKVYVKDAVGTTINKLSTAVPVTEPLAITGITANKTGAVTGEMLTWTASATGGSGTLKYYFILYKDGTKVTTRAYSTANTFTYTPAEPGTYRVRVYVKDSLDTKVNKLSSGVKTTESITVTGIMADKTSAVLGEAITWSAAAVGGEGTLQYWFRIYKDGTVVKKGTYGTVQAFTYTPTEPGVYKAKVYVKDAVGTTVSKVSTAVTVTEPLAITGITANKTSAVTGAPLTWTAAAAGGTGTLKYYFILYKDGTKITTRAYSTANTFTYTPAEPGTYRVRVYVKDAVETKANKLSGGVTVTG